MRQDIDGYRRQMKAIRITYLIIKLILAVGALLFSIGVVFGGIALDKFKGGWTMGLYLYDMAHKPIVEQCQGCGLIDGDICKAYAYPAAKWRNGQPCPLASHVSTGAIKIGRKVNPLKASKRANKGR